MSGIPSRQEAYSTAGGEKRRRRGLRAAEADKWHEHFQSLLDFKNIHNHTLVPHRYLSNPPLGHWVKRQRYLYKQFHQGKESSSMLLERFELLENLGFVWDSHEVSWKEKLEELIEYKRTHGDCDVPYYYSLNPQLATWATRQRRQCTLYKQNKKSGMTPKRIAILEDLGFKWNTRVSKSTKKILGEGTTKYEEPTGQEVPLVLPYIHHSSSDISNNTLPSTLEERNETPSISQVLPSKSKGLGKILPKGFNAADQAPLALGHIQLSEPSDWGTHSDTDLRMFLETLDDLDDLSSDGGENQSKKCTKPTKKKARLDLNPPADGFSYHENILSSVLSDLSADAEDNKDDDVSLTEFDHPWSETFDTDFILNI